MATPNPTAILIIHGGYFLPPSWDPFTEDLTNAGFTVRCPRLPTCGDARPPTALLSHDVSAVRTAATELIEAGHTILVLAHSYGGIVASEAITRDLYSSPGKKGGVVQLIYLSAWLVPPGSSVASAIEKYGFQCKVDLGENGDGTVFAKNAPESFYNDIEPARAEELAKSNVTHNWGAAAGAVTSAPWKDLPTTYVHCTRDLAIMLPLQRSLVKDAVEVGGEARFETAVIESGHCPFLSRPGELMRVIGRVVDGGREGVSEALMR